MSQQLSPTTESLRQQIKNEIAEAVPKRNPPQENKATFYEEDENGNRAYGGSALEKKVPQLVRGMRLGEDLTWSLAYFSQPRPIINKFSRMWLIPLSDNAIITPGGSLKEGVCTLITDEPVLGSDSPVIFIAPE